MPAEQKGRAPRTKSAWTYISPPQDRKVAGADHVLGRHPYHAQPSGEQRTSPVTHSLASANDSRDMAQLERGAGSTGGSWSGKEEELQPCHQQCHSGLLALPSIHDFLAQQQGTVEGPPRTEYWQPPRVAGWEHVDSPTFEAGRSQQHYDENSSAAHHPASQDYRPPGSRTAQDLRGRAEGSRGYGAYGEGREVYGERHNPFSPPYPPPSVSQLYRPDYGNLQSILHPAPSHPVHPVLRDYPLPDSRFYPPYVQPFRRSSAPELSFVPNDYQHYTPQYPGAYRTTQHTASSSSHSFSHHADDSPFSSPHANSPLPSSSRNPFPSPPSTSSGPYARPPPESDLDNPVLFTLYHRANLYPPFGPEQLAIVWDGSQSRALAWDSFEARSLGSHSENDLIVFEKGGWVGVRDKHGYEAFPWSAGKGEFSRLLGREECWLILVRFVGANDWLRLQAEHCLCKRFKFWQGTFASLSFPLCPPNQDSCCRS
mgnify:CR=1 FL=1